MEIGQDLLHIVRNNTAHSLDIWIMERFYIFQKYPFFMNHSQILLVGNMGLYDYRPYVKKITNNRQIIFDCDKGWRLRLGSAEGATCIGSRFFITAGKKTYCCFCIIGGEWSPPGIPSCVRENHPEIKWLVQIYVIHIVYGVS